ncbi:hypothetical protein [Argonema antarcticum]|uniref:hypothetical protein n=1 Tax=Argonema antarcticum TaxID=2942763 RepID=UPI00201264D4|nr:hypothetical protein [Argonema antarcticum]MCL1473781.1 hypothetical protein [Argonema antarcticum A004/B2]
MNSAFSNTNINVQLVESLIQAIQALSPAEQILVRSRLLANLPQTNTQTTPPKQSVIDILKQSPGQQLFQTSEEVDRYLQQERSSWDS